MILSDSLQMRASMGKEDKDTRNGLKTTVCNGLLLFFHSAPKLEISQKKAPDHYLGKAVIKVVIKCTFFL